MDVFVVVGESDARKSSTIRALTGANYATPSSVRKNWDIEFGRVTEPTFVLTSAMQEAKISPQSIVTQIRKSGVTKAILALRHHPANSMPHHDVYLAAFAAEGWNTHVAWLGLVGNSAHTTTEYPLPNSARDAVNITAAKLRRRWTIS